ncbi:MAG: addiction module toxin, HicA family [Chloroflexi bacterium]|nr:addiction module toxin, HicA family [Chloroflexota bacterium]
MKLPPASGKQTVDALLRTGFIIHRTRGSHYILKDARTGRRVTIPYHRQALAPKTLHSILRQAGVSTETFLKLL